MAETLFKAWSAGSNGGNPPRPVGAAPVGGPDIVWGNLRTAFLSAVELLKNYDKSWKRI